MPIANSGKNLKASDKLKIITDGTLKCKEAKVKLLGMIIDKKTFFRASFEYNIQKS